MHPLGHKFWPQPGHITFVEIHHNSFYDHSLLSADSRKAVVSYRRKYVHSVLVNCSGGLSLPMNSVIRLTSGYFHVPLVSSYLKKK